MSRRFLVGLLMRFIVATRLLMFLPTDLVGLLLFLFIIFFLFYSSPKASQSIFILGVLSISSNKVVFVMHHYRITPENFFGGLFWVHCIEVISTEGF